jgi:hypothetical protein
MTALKAPMNADKVQPMTADEPGSELQPFHQGTV